MKYLLPFIFFPLLISSRFLLVFLLSVSVLFNGILRTEMGCIIQTCSIHCHFLWNRGMVLFSIYSSAFEMIFRFYVTERSIIHLQLLQFEGFSFSSLTIIPVFQNVGVSSGFNLISFVDFFEMVDVQYSLILRNSLFM